MFYRIRAVMITECRFPEKQWFRTRQLARIGMADIRHYVEHVKGGTYQTLHPYRCGNHWHLSHYRQGTAICRVCNQRRSAWFGGAVWIMAAHGGCTGEGKCATNG